MIERDEWHVDDRASEDSDVDESGQPSARDNWRIDPFVPFEKERERESLVSR